MAVVAMKPSWAVMAGGSSLSVSLPHRNVRVLAAVAGLPAAGAVVGAAAGLGASVGFAAAAGAVVAAAAGLGASVGFGAAAGAEVGAAAGAPGPQAASRPMPAANPAMLRNRRRETIVVLPQEMLGRS